MTVTSAGDDSASGHKATPGATADFLPDSQTFTFTPSEIAAGTTKEFTVILQNDSVVEYAQETYKVSWSWTDDSGNSQTQAMYPVIIDDDEAHYWIEPSAASLAYEGSSGIGHHRYFKIFLDNKVDIPVYIDYWTSSLTATAGSDYTAVSDTAPFPAGTTMYMSDVSLVGDDMIEADEEFSVGISLQQLSEPRAIYPAAPTSLTLPIQNDDEGVLRLVTQNQVTGAYEVVSGPVARSEGAGAFQFRVGIFDPTTDLPRTADVDVMINYATSNGTAIAGGAVPYEQDFTAIAGQVPIPAGQASVDLLSITINDDGFVELPEEFSLAVTAQDSGRDVGGSPSGTCRILDNEGNTNVSIGDVSVGEPAGGFVDILFVVTMSKPVDYPVSISYWFVDVTATNGTNGDYSASAGDLVFQPGVTSRNITVRVYHDNVSGEGAETFRVHLGLADDGGRAVYFHDPIAVGTIND